MSVIVVGLNHRTAPVELRERVAVPSSRLDKALHDLSSREHLAEVVLLSTCNRTEIYARSTKFHSAVSDVLDFLAEQGGAPPETFSEHLYTYYDDSAVSHLFGVAAGLDSMILGEGEILGQVRGAWRQAETEGASGQALARVFRHAIETGKRVRTETAIGRSALSVSSAAVALAERTMFSLEGGHAAATRLIRHGVTGIVCASDPIALGAIRAARRAGLSVPADVSVVGYDDSAFMNCTDPPLTTVRQPIEAIGRAAVAMLTSQIEGSAVQAEELFFEPELVARGSTAAAPVRLDARV